MDQKSHLFIALLFLFAACAPRGLSAPAWPDPYSDELLYWCIPADNADGIWAVDDKEPDCGKGRVSRGQWSLSRIPLTVNADPDLMFETMEAVTAMNIAMGFELMVFQVSNLDPDIAVVEAGMHWFAAAEAKRTTVDGKHHGLVRVYNDLQDKDRSEIMLHELGHLIGLRHDHDNSMSIMSWNRSRVATIEPEDVAVIRALYLR